ncbi:hypothetical protein [Nitrobacter sp.]
MLQRSDEARLDGHAAELTRMALRVQTFALYGSLALIAAVVFGSLSIHPF